MHGKELTKVGPTACFKLWKMDENRIANQNLGKNKCLENAPERQNVHGLDLFTSVIYRCFRGPGSKIIGLVSP